MKKLLILASMLILIGVGKSMAGQADLFSYDAVTIENQMAQLDQLEGYVLDNPGITLGKMTTSDSAFASMVSGPNGISVYYGFNEKLLGIPGFLWGCFGGPIGVLLVHFVGKDESETKKALIGCVVEAAILGGSYGLSIALGLGSGCLGAY